MVLKFYSRFIICLAILAALTLCCMVFGIVIDVVLRNLGYHPIQALSALIEYGMLFTTMAGAPWLVRNHGHVAITSFIEALPESLALIVSRAVLLITIVALSILAWRACAVCFELIETGEIDMRSIDIPRWVLPAMLASGFGLMAIEFLRLFIIGDLRLGSELAN